MLRRSSRLSIKERKPIPSSAPIILREEDEDLEDEGEEYEKSEEKKSAERSYYHHKGGKAIQFESLELHDIEPNTLES